MDHSAPWTTDINGEDIFYEDPPTDLKLKDGSYNPELFEFWRKCNS